MPPQSPSMAPARVELVVQQPPASPSNPWAQGIRDAAWPLVVVLAVVLFRRGIADALKGLTSRASKLSIGIFAVELAGSTARSWGGAALDEIRDKASNTPVGDSGSALMASLSEGTRADYAAVDLGEGTEWLTSRLFAVATLVARLRGLHVVVFTTSSPVGPLFVGLADVESLRRSLAIRYPWLEVGLIEAWRTTIQSPARDVERKFFTPSKFDLLDPYRAGALFTHFRAALQHSGPPPPATTGWEQLSDKLWERAEWVTSALLGDLLGDALARAAVLRDGDTTPERFARRVLRATGDYAAVVDSRGVFQELINRRNFLERSGKQIADEE